MIKIYRDLKKRNNRIIKKHNQETAFIILLYFLATFIVVRTIIYAVTFHFIPDFFITVKGVHIHHFNYGIFILAIAGFWSLIRRDNGNLSKISKFYAIGLALTFDEFGVWLNLQDAYWIRQSYDAIIIVGVVFLNIIYFNGIWRKIIKKNVSLGRKIWEKLFRKSVLKFFRLKKVLVKK